MLKRIIAAIITAAVLVTGPAAAYAKPKLAFNPANHKNPGHIKGYNEALGMIDIAKKAKIIADRNGLDSKIFWDGYRDGGGVSSLKREVARANKYGPSLFMAMHSDGVPSSRGILVLYKDEAGKRAGSVVGGHIAKKMGLKFEGLSYRPELLVLRQSKSPAILIEYLSHANPSDNKKLNDPVYREKLGEATVEGYAKYMGYKVHSSRAKTVKPVAKKSIPVKAAESVKDKAENTVEGITKDVETLTTEIEKSVSPSKADESKMIKVGEQLKIKPVTQKSADFEKIANKTSEQTDITVPAIIKDSLKSGIDYLKISFGIGSIFN